MGSFDQLFFPLSSLENSLRHHWLPDCPTLPLGTCAAGGGTHSSLFVDYCSPPVGSRKLGKTTYTVQDTFTFCLILGRHCCPLEPVFAMVSCPTSSVVVLTHATTAVTLHGGGCRVYR